MTTELIRRIQVEEGTLNIANIRNRTRIKCVHEKNQDSKIHMEHTKRKS